LADPKPSRTQLPDEPDFSTINISHVPPYVPHEAGFSWTNMDFQRREYKKKASNRNGYWLL